jgi:hypothetical protein
MCTTVPKDPETEPSEVIGALQPCLVHSPLECLHDKVDCPQKDPNAPREACNHTILRLHPPQPNTGTKASKVASRAREEYILRLTADRLLQRAS